METSSRTDIKPDESPGQGPSEVVELLDSQGVAHEVLNERALRVVIPSGDVVMGAVPYLSAATSAVAILAEGRDGTSAVLLRDGQDMFVVRRDPGVWEHFRSMGGPSAVVGSWRSGQRTRFRQRHGALWQKIEPAIALAETLGVADLMPAETPPPPPPAPEPTPAPRRSATPRAGRKPAEKKPVDLPPPPPVCPRCFMQLPSSGRCDCS